MEEKKLCKACLIEKSLNQFYTSKAMKDGYMNTCKICKRDGKKIHREYDTPPKFNRTYSKLDNSYGKMYQVSQEDYRVMYEFLAIAGYDIEKDIHQQFLDRWNPQCKKPMKYRKRASNSVNSYLPNGERNPDNRKHLFHEKSKEQKKSPTN